LILQTLGSLCPLDVLGFQTLFACNDFEGNLIAFIQGFESFAYDTLVMHKNIGTGTLGDEAESLFVVKPLDFAAGHISLPSCEAMLQAKNGRCWKPVCARKLSLETAHASTQEKS
jgi:hypothetical protein